MIMTEKFLDHMMSENAADYISLRELVGDDMLDALQEKFEGEISKRTEFPDSIFAFADRVHVKFPKIEDISQVPVRDDLIYIDPHNFGEEIQEYWSDVSESIKYSTYEKADEEWPVVVDMFEVRGIVFGFKFENKEMNLEEVMDFMVQEEEYEKAAKIRDILSEMGSNAVKSND